MKIAVTGSSGILGSSFVSFFEKNNINFFKVDRNNYDPKDSFNEIVNYFKSEKTSIIIHCAANTDVEFCEEHKDKCLHDNYTLTKILTKVSKKLNLKLVFISSTGVYGNHKIEPYIETDIIKPPTAYHKAKYESEEYIKQHLKDFLILRTGWLFGGNSQSSKNFVINRLIEAKKSNGQIFSNIDQKGNPTFTNDLVKTIHNLIEKNISGLFNCVNQGSASRFEYVSEIIQLLDIDVSVREVKKNAFKRIANVSNNEMALNFHLTKLNLNDMPRWELSLKKYINSLNLKV